MNCERTLIAPDQEKGAVTARLSAMTLITASDKRYLSQFPAGRQSRGGLYQVTRTFQSALGSVQHAPRAQVPSQLVAANAGEFIAHA